MVFVSCSVSVRVGGDSSAFNLPDFWEAAYGAWSAVCVTVDGDGQVQVRAWTDGVAQSCLTAFTQAFLNGELRGTGLTQPIPHVPRVANFIGRSNW